MLEKIRSEVPSSNALDSSCSPFRSFSAWNQLLKSDFGVEFRGSDHQDHADIVPVQQNLWQLRVVSTIVARKYVNTSLATILIGETGMDIQFCHIL